MATIKLQNGKVITKGGKVSCECCTPIVGCCMYPSRPLSDGFYIADDLPDEIDYEYFAGNSGPLIITLPKSGMSYSGQASHPLGGQIDFKVELNQSGSNWRYTASSPYGADPNGLTPCLFDNIPSGSPLKDKFLDTYTLSYSHQQFGGPVQNFSTTLTRMGLCDWQGDNPGPVTTAPFWFLDYFNSSDGNNIPGVLPRWGLFAGGIDGTFKDGPKNSPTGNYFNRFNLFNIVIS